MLIKTVCYVSSNELALNELKALGLIKRKFSND